MNFSAYNVVVSTTIENYLLSTRDCAMEWPATQDYSYLHQAHFPMRVSHILADS